MARSPASSDAYWFRALKVFVVLGGVLIALGMANWLYYLATR